MRPELGGYEGKDVADLLQSGGSSQQQPDCPQRRESFQLPDPVVTFQSVPVRTSLMHWILLIALLRYFSVFNIIYYTARDSDSQSRCHSSRAVGRCMTS